MVQFSDGDEEFYCDVSGEGCLLLLAAFFALRPVGRRVPTLPRLFFEPSMANSCWSSQAPLLAAVSLTR